MSRKNQNVHKAQHPQQSFQQLLADATLAKLGGYIDAKLDEAAQRIAQSLAQRQATAMASLFTRLVSIEDILMQKLEGVTKETIAENLAAVEDKNEGFELVTGELVKGDRARLELRIKTKDDAEYQGTSRMLINNAGTGQTLGKELEEGLLGMKANEIKEVKFGKDASMTAEIKINRISREIKAEVEEAQPEADAAPAQETQDVDQNAG